MNFSAPLWLMGSGALSILLVLGWRLHDRRQRAALLRFVAMPLAARLTPSLSPLRRRLQRGFFLLALSALCVALAGPLLGYHWQVLNRRGEQIIFALDTSRSMLSPDLKPSRLVRAKLAVDDLAREFEGNALGIVAFAGTAFLACPLTFDVSAFRATLGAIDIHTIPRGGTSVSSAIRAAQVAFGRQPGMSRVLILVTDGEDLEGGALQAAEAAARDGIRIFALGVGSRPGELIPLPAEEGGGFVKDEKGAIVRSHLDEGALREIAAKAGGVYVALEAEGSDVDAALKGALQAMAKQDLASRQQRIYTQRYQWPLCVALASLLASLLIDTRRRVNHPGRVAVSATLFVLLLTLPLRPMRAADTAPAPEDPARAYNRGTAEYRAGRFRAAGDAFQNSIRQAPSASAQRLADQQDAYYDLGNALYRAGQATQQTSRDDTLKAWGAAVKAYDTALQLRPDDQDSRFNRDFVKKKIDELNQPPPQGGGGQGKPPPGQPPPGGATPPAKPPNGQPAPGAPPPGGRPPQPPSPPASPPSAPDSGQPQAGEPQMPPPAQGDRAEAPRDPGQMSRDEAAQLLDSAKGDEKRAPAAPAADQDGYRPPDEKPYRNW